MFRITRPAAAAALSTIAFVALPATSASAHIQVPPAPKVVSAWAGNSSSGSFSPQHVTIIQTQQVRWGFGGAAQMSATDSSGMGLFNSGARGHTSSPYLFTFEAAGTYPYHSTTSVAATGLVSVTLRRSPCFRDARHDVCDRRHQQGAIGLRVRRRDQAPGGAWKWWHYGVTGTSVSFKATKTGWWQFRSRLRRTSNNKVSDLSPVFWWT